MSRLSAQSIRELCTGFVPPMITPFEPEKVVVNGKSYGLSHASYDCRIAHDLTLGVHPGILMAQSMLRNDPYGRMVDLLDKNPPHFALAHTIEDFHFPDNVSGQVADKSTYARLFVSAFNTFFDPGFHGNATLELVNLSDKPVVYKAGDPVCQFLFDWLDKPTDNPYRGKYQNQPKKAVGPIFEGPKS